MSGIPATVHFVWVTHYLVAVSSWEVALFNITCLFNVWHGWCCVIWKTTINCVYLLRKRCGVAYRTINDMRDLAGESQAGSRFYLKTTFPGIRICNWNQRVVRHFYCMVETSILVIQQSNVKSFRSHNTLIWPKNNFNTIGSLWIWWRHARYPGVGVTKAPFVNLSVSKIFDLTKVHLKLFESHLYLTGATAAELRRHLPNINMIFNSQHVFWHCWKIRKITERRKMA